MLCRTNVPSGGGFAPCGKPAPFGVRVGLVNCHYCQEHAEAARRFVEGIGVEGIAEIQRRTMPRLLG
jgi:hypothetical protein